MHDTSLLSGASFADVYGRPGAKVIDLGGLDVNGSLRKFFVEKGMTFICLDMEKHPSVDIVYNPGEKLPFETGTIDLIVSTSCFEHDPLFWMTFKEMCRVVKLGGYIYINAPNNGPYHRYPGDNWRFYADAGQALAYWSGIKINEEEVYPAKVIETFHISPIADPCKWVDFVCVWQRVEQKETTILVSKEIREYEGPLKKEIHKRGGKTVPYHP